MSRLTITSGRPSALRETLAERVAELRGEDPLTPITLLVGASLQRPYLARWLAIAPRNAERVWQHSKAWFFEAMRHAASDAKIKWKQNALRHSFISYRLAEIQDVNRVSLEAGNSPQMIFRHYRELATPEQARTWFSIAPATSNKVIAMSAGQKR